MGLMGNPVYDSSSPLPNPSTKEGATGDEYATMVKPKKKDGQVDDSSKLYAHVDKTHRGKKKGLKDNPVYDSSGPLAHPSTKEGATGDEYATVLKPKKQGVQVEDSDKLYAQKDQTKKGKKKGQAKGKHGKVPRGDIYENATLAGRDNFKGNMYANSGDLKTDENVYENPNEDDSRGMAKKDGLMYADLMLDGPTMKNGKYVIRGLDNRTEYADLTFDKRGEPFPDNNEE